jgi:hypothetical protein
MLSIYLQDVTTTTEREDDAKDCNKDTTGKIPIHSN